MSSKKMDHVDYEIDMLKKTHDYLNDLYAKADATKFAIDIGIESHMTHLRNLLNFFMYTEGNTGTIKKNNDRHDDIYYTDFPSAINIKKTDISVEDYKLIMRTIDKQISHLTKARFEENAEDDQRKVLEMAYPLILGTIEEFQNAVKEEVKAQLEQLNSIHPKQVHFTESEQKIPSYPVTRTTYDK